MLVWAPEWKVFREVHRPLDFEESPTTRPLKGVFHRTPDRIRRVCQGELQEGVAPRGELWRELPDGGACTQRYVDILL